MVDNAQGIEKIFLPHVWAPLESEVKSLKKIDFFQMIFFFWIFLTLLVSGRVKRMLGGIFWCLVCVNWTTIVELWLSEYNFWDLGSQRHEMCCQPQVVAKKFSFEEIRTLGVDDVHMIECGIFFKFLPGPCWGRIWKMWKNWIFLRGVQVHVWVNKNDLNIISVWYLNDLWWSMWFALDKYQVCEIPTMA